MKIKEIRTKEEFLEVLSETMTEIDEANQFLNTFGEKMQNPKMMLNLMLQQSHFDEENHFVVQKCFDEFNELKKSIFRIENKRNRSNELLNVRLFKQFYVDSHDYAVKAIDLKDNIEKYKKLVNEQIIKCIDYLNFHEVKITL